MLDQIFVTVTNMSITASIVVVVIMGVRLVLRQKLPKLFSYALWSIVLIRLLIPYSFSSPISILNIMPEISQPSMDVRTIQYLPKFAESPPGVTKESVQNEAMKDSVSMSTTLGFADIIGQAALNLSVIWLGGFVLLFGFCSITYLQTINQLKTSIKYSDTGLILELLDKVGIKREIGIYTSDMIHSPVVCGVVKSRLILPVTLVEGSDKTILQHMIVHELVHIKRLDSITNAISVLALCIHWFNPIVWISFLLSRKDMEMSCDERVLSIIGGHIRIGYARSLLSLAVKQNNLLNGGVLAFGESNIKSRIKSIMRYKKPAFRAGIASVVILGFLGAVLISNPFVTTGTDMEIDLSALEKNPLIENWTNYQDIPDYLINSVIAIEDENFRKHSGIDWIKASSVLIQMIIPPSESSISGGATITQQLVKNIAGDQDRNVQRKKREVKRAIALEKKYTKEQILEGYLNTIYFGNQTVGVENAANYYFGKRLKELSLSESASLAAVIDRPNYDNPVDNPENNKSKRDVIIDKMFHLKMITAEEKQQALAENPEVNGKKATPQ